MIKLSKDKDNNAFYNQLKHVNQFYTVKKFKQTAHVLTIKESIKHMHHAQMESFEHASDFFKKPKHVYVKKIKSKYRKKDTYKYESTYLYVSFISIYN